MTTVIVGFKDGKPLSVTCPNDGLPHILMVEDITIYMVDGKYHRVDGPAYVSSDTQMWYENGLLNNTSGPSIINPSGEFWYMNGKLHRDGDAAITRKSGDKEWYQHGINYNPNGPSLIVNGRPIYNDSNGKFVYMA